MAELALVRWSNTELADESQEQFDERFEAKLVALVLARLELQIERMLELRIELAELDEESRELRQQAQEKRKAKSLELWMELQQLVCKLEPHKVLSKAELELALLQERTELQAVEA
jgi:lipid II:glycine glycyltransferase (peptidoglycan interpeptide bridge formation enzyme)